MPLSCCQRCLQRARSVRGVFACVTLLLCGLVAGCSSSRVPGPQPKPGYQSPDNAVAGFVDNLLHDRAAAACRYTVPDERAACTVGLELFRGAEQISGQWALGNGATSGDRAIVDVEYKQACENSANCLSNSNPNAGLPGDGVSFDAAFQRALSTLDYATDCMRLGGRWYVYNVSSVT
jgi:hypothetical protein